MKYPKIQLKAYDWYSYFDEGSDNREFPLGTVDILGWLISEDHDKVVVAMEHFSSHDTVRKVMSIPKGCIVTRKKLK